MTITQVRYKLEDFPNMPFTDFLLGNIGDRIRIEILFTAATNTFTAVNFLWNLRPNSDDITLNFNAANRKRNLQTQTELNYFGTVTQVNGATNSLPIRNDKSAGEVFPPIFETVNTAAKQYKITWITTITPYLLPNNAANNTLSTPSFFLDNESLKPYFEITCFTSVLDTTVEDNGNNYSNPATAKNGNVGYFNEKFNNVAAPYELVSFSYDNLTTLDANQDVLCTARIKTNTLPFAVTNSITLIIFDITSTFVGSKSFNENQNLDGTIIINPNGVFSNSLFGRLTNVVTIIDNTDLVISFTIPANTSPNQFCIYAKVIQDITVASNPIYNNVLLKLDTPEAAVFEPVNLIPYPNAFYPLVFLYHYSDDIPTATFNHIKSFVGDWHQALFKVQPQNNAVMDTITAQVVTEDGDILDNIFTVSTASLPYQETRQFNLLDTVAGGNYRQTNSVIKVVNDFECKAAFLIQEDWTSLNTVQFWVTINGTQNGLTFTEVFKSPTFVLQTYEETLNSNTEPQALGYTTPPPGSKVFKLQSNPLVVSDFIFAGLDTTTECFFRDDNTNNLEVTNPNQLAAYITINSIDGTEETKQSIHSEWDISESSPFYEQPPAGVGRVLIELISPPTPEKEAKITANIDWAKLQALYNTNKFKISWRLDKKQTNQFYFARHLLHTRGTNPRFLPYIEFTDIIQDFTLIDVLGAANSVLYRFSEEVSPVWGSILAVPKATLLTQIAGATGVYKVQIVPNLKANLLEGTFVFQYVKTGVLTPSSWSYDFADTISSDTVIGFNEKISVTSISNAPYMRVREDRTTDWNTLPLITTLLGLNNAIIATAGSYEIQVINFSKTVLTINYIY